MIHIERNKSNITTAHPRVRGGKELFDVLDFTVSKENVILQAFSLMGVDDYEKQELVKNFDRFKMLKHVVKMSKTQEDKE